MGVRVWLDDVRPMPEGFDVWVKNAHDMKMMILRDFPRVEYLSFDHDLGGGKNNTGYTVAVCIEALASIGRVHPIGWDIHSANPVGRKRIEQTMISAQRFWE